MSVVVKFAVPPKLRDGIAELIFGQDAEREGRARDTGRRRACEDELAQGARCYQHVSTRAGNRAGDRVGRGDRLIACRFQCADRRVVLPTPLVRRGIAGQDRQAVAAGEVNRPGVRRHHIVGAVEGRDRDGDRAPRRDGAGGRRHLEMRGGGGGRDDDRQAARRVLELRHVAIRVVDDRDVREGPRDIAAQNRVGGNAGGGQAVKVENQGGRAAQCQGTGREIEFDRNWSGSRGRRSRRY